MTISRHDHNGFSYLMRGEKSLRMRRLNSLIKYERTKAPTEEYRGIDLDFVPLLRRINKLPGVCTTQCCTGHGKGDGYISLRFTSKLNRAFERRVPDIVRDCFILQVSQLYEGHFPDGVRPRWLIWFTAWPHSVQRIAQFVEGIVKNVRAGGKRNG